MRGRWLNRALSAAAGVVVSLTTATVSLAADPAYRFAGIYDVPVLLDASVAPANALRNPLGEISTSFALNDTFWLDTGFNADVARMLDRYVPGKDAFNGLFYSGAAYGSSYTGLASGGSYAGLHAKLMDGVNFSLGMASLEPGLNPYRVDSRNAAAALGGRLPLDLRYTQSVLAGLSWNFARWGSVGFTASRSDEHGGVLGLSNPALGARTQALGVTANVNFGGGWVTTASYSEGLTQLALRPGSISPSVRTESFGVAVAKQGLFKKNDALGVAFAQPTPGFAGLTPADRTNELQFYGRDKILSSIAQETDIELGYKTEFFGDSVALQANASYQMNTGGVNGRDSVSLLSKAKIKF
jgi:hypothetical protein